MQHTKNAWNIIHINGDKDRLDAERLDRALALYSTYQENKLEKLVGTREAFELCDELGELDRLRKALREDIDNARLQNNLPPFRRFG